MSQPGPSSEGPGVCIPLFLYALKESHMCTRPVTQDDKTFACRSCNECISNRRHQWVARAMMEKAVSPHTLCIALSYDESTQSNRDAARMFQYADVRAFLARLRAAIYDRSPGSWVRFLIAGEQGDRNGRCHWHAILYSDVPLWTFGDVKGMKDGQKAVLTDWADMVSTSNRKRRLDWSLWGKGFVTFQAPDLGAMHYVLSYVLKDQFTPEKSRETGREGKTDNFATGLFRMSKRPAIGERFFYEKLAALDAKGWVLPSLDMAVPGLKGYYQPAGSFRKKLLWALSAMNRRAIWATGRNAPQWSSLVGSCADNEMDMEILNGPAPQDTLEFECDQNALGRDVEWQRDEARKRRFAATCGRARPCRPCLTSLEDDELAKLGVVRTREAGQCRWRDRDTGLDLFEPGWEQGSQFVGRSNPFCQRRGSKISRATFPASDGGGDL